MKHMTIQEVKTAMLKSGKNWRIPFMEDDSGIFPKSPSSRFNTCLYRKTMALRAWFWVLAATFLFTVQSGHRSGLRRGESSVVFTARFSCGYYALC